MSSDDLASAQRLVGRVLDDKYRLRGCIGIGGSGAVYKADQIALGRTVAVKILNDELASDPRLVKRFQDEALAASRLNHPNTVSVIDYGQTPDGLLYLVMEYLRGPTLTHLIAKEYPIPPGRVLGIIDQILAGIEEAHLAGVIHADLKSDNIIIEQRRTGQDQVKVVDFGIARLLNNPREGEDRNICGTPEYMAPELIGGSPSSVATDLYAVGIVAYELLTGQTPFVGGSAVDILTRQLKQQPAPVSSRISVSPAIDAFVMRALAKRPQERFADAASMRMAIPAVVSTPSSPVLYVCAHCFTHSQTPFRFCPECGQPRKPLTQTTEMVARAGAMAEAERGPPWPIGLVGRDAELDVVVDFLAGRTAAPALLVTGEAGSGRTALLTAAYERAADAIGVTIYQADADPSGLASPLYPLRALVATMLELPPVCGRDDLAAAAVARGLVERDVPGLAELFGYATDLGELDPPVRRRETFASLVRVLAAEATRGPTAVVFEDLDRYDRASVELVRRVAERDHSGVRIVVTTTAEAGRTWPSDCVRVDLARLDGEALTFVASQLGRTALLADLNARELAERTGGMPAHVEHLVRYLTEGGALELAPSSLPDLVAARLASLPRDTLVVCQAAAVFGREADLALVEQAAELGDGFTPALTVAEQRGWLHVANGVVTFPSLLVRDVTYGAMPAHVRTRLHDFARASLAALPQSIAVLAHHTEAAGHRAEAAQLHADAGDIAMRQLDEVGAARCFNHALVCARQALATGEVPPAVLVAISIRLAEVLRVTGELALARGILHEAENWGDQGPRLQALLVRALGQLVAAESDASAAVPYLQRAIGAAIATGDGDLIAETYLDLASVLTRVGKGSTATRELEEAVDLMTLGDGPRTPRAPTLLWKVVLKLAQLAVADDDLVKAVEYAEIALAQATRVEATIGVAHTRALLSSCYERLGNHVLAERHRRGAVEEMRRMGDRRGTAELMLYGTTAGRTLLKISPDVLREARELAREVGWTEGVNRATTAVRE